MSEMKEMQPSRENSAGIVCFIKFVRFIRIISTFLQNVSYCVQIILAYFLFQEEEGMVAARNLEVTV